MHEALYSGTKSSLIALGVSAAVVLGACKAFPSVARSLSVSGKTALIVRLRDAAIGAGAVDVSIATGRRLSR